MVLLILILIGYPAVSTVNIYLDISGNIFTVVYRAFVLALSVCILGFAIVSKRYRFDPWLMTFIILYATRLVYDYFFANIRGTDFVLLFYGVVVFIPTLALGASRLGTDRDKALTRLLIGIGGPTVMALLLAQQLGLAYNPWADQGGTTNRLGFEVLNPITLGYTGLIVMIAALVHLTVHRDRFFWAAASIAALVSGVALIIVAGSRGPLISAVVCVAWYGLSKISRLFYLVPAAIVLFVVVLSQSYVFQHVLETVTGGWANDVSSLERLRMQKWAIDDFLSSPFIGAHYASNPADGGFSPHNIPVETAMALGVVGIFVLLAIAVRVARSLGRSFNSAHPLLTLLLLMHAVNAMLSGTLWESDALFALLLLALIHKEQRPARRHLPKLAGGVHAASLGAQSLMAR